MKFASSLLLAVVLLAGAGCNKNMAIANGKAVKINYTLTVDGKVVDSSQGKPPLAFVHGTGQIIPGLEEALMGMKAGEKKQVTVGPEKGYGPIDPKAQQKIPKNKFKDTKDLKVGVVVNGQSNGQPIQAKVVAVGPKDVTLDFNHPLAGKTLNFDVEVVEVANAPKAG